VVDHFSKSFQSQVPVSYGFVPVFMALKGILSVVDMDGFQSVQTNHPVKFFQNLVGFIFDVITRIENMTCVQAYAQPVLYPDAVHDHAQLFKSASYLGTLSGHGFQQHPGCLVFGDGSVQGSGNEFNPFFHTLLHMTSGMEIVQVPGGEFHSVQIIQQRVESKLAYACFGRTKVHRVGCMRKDRTDVVVPGKGKKCLHIVRIDGFCGPSAGIACEELEGVGSYPYGGFCHGQVACRGRKMAPYAEII